MYDEPSITFEDYKEADKLQSLFGLRDKCKNPGKHSEGTTVSIFICALSMSSHWQHDELWSYKDEVGLIN